MQIRSLAKTVDTCQPEGAFRIDVRGLISYLIYFTDVHARWSQTFYSSASSMLGEAKERESMCVWTQIHTIQDVCNINGNFVISINV
jgi:hypothetical protein